MGSRYPGYPLHYITAWHGMVQIKQTEVAPLLKMADFMSVYDFSNHVDVQASQVILQSLPVLYYCLGTAVCLWLMNTSCQCGNIWYTPLLALSICRRLTCICVSPVGSGVTQREDLAWLQRAARCEENVFYRVSLQQPAKALWSTALRPRLWPHEQVGLLKAVSILCTIRCVFTVLYSTHSVFCLCVAVQLHTVCLDNCFFTNHCRY